MCRLKKSSNVLKKRTYTLLQTQILKNKFKLKVKINLKNIFVIIIQNNKIILKKEDFYYKYFAFNIITVYS